MSEEFYSTQAGSSVRFVRISNLSRTDSSFAMWAPCRPAKCVDGFLVGCLAIRPSCPQWALSRIGQLCGAANQSCYISCKSQFQLRTVQSTSCERVRQRRLRCFLQHPGSHPNNLAAARWLCYGLISSYLLLGESANARL